MGYHANIQAQLVTLLKTSLGTSIPVLQGIAVTDVEMNRLAACVAIVRESIDAEPHEELNPETTTADQLETWRWTLYVKGGGGAINDPAKGTEVDKILETTRTALNAQRLSSQCGPLHFSGEYYEGNVGTGVVYTQMWYHTKLGD